MGSGIDLWLAVDSETSGIAYKTFDPTDNGRFQSVSWGVIVLDGDLNELDKGYLEIQWNGESEWSDGAERVHGLSKEYLAENGVSEQEAVLLIGGLIEEYWGNRGVNLLGHNVTSFDRFFLYDLFKRQGVNINLNNRCLDTFSLGYGTVGAQDSDSLFKTLGYQDRGAHNAMDDIEMTVQVVRDIKRGFRQAVRNQ